LPRAKVLGVVNFPTFRASMAGCTTHRETGPERGRVGRPNNDRSVARHPAFRPTIDAALIGEPQAILLVEFSGDDKAALLGRLRALDELMGDLNRPRVSCT